MTELDRWLAKVDVRGPNECWEWTGSRQKGYGQFDGMRAHRYAYIALVGPIPAGAVIRHSCDNRPCVNPAHLVPGTQQDNVNDRESRGRGARPWGQSLTRSRSTHCKRGHEYTPANTLTRGTRRACAACQKMTAAAWYQRKKQLTNKET